MPCFPFEDEIPEIELYGLEELTDRLYKHGGRTTIARASLAIAYLGGLTISDLQYYTGAVPAFNNAGWDKIAPKFGLDSGKSIWQLDTFEVPLLSLPPSFHRQVMKNSAQWLDVYQEAGSHRRATPRLRLMDAWHVPICALFKGRIVDFAQNPVPESPESSGGWIEHEVHMAQGIILIVIQLNLYFKDPHDNIAQALLGLVSAYKTNRAEEFDNQPPVYALLTDMREFHFLRYDGSKFTLYDHEIFVSARSRSAFLGGMRSVTEHLFSIIFEGYVKNLDAIASRESKSRGSAGDVPKGKFGAVGQSRQTNSVKQRASELDKWMMALSFAKKAQHALAHVDHKSLTAWETSATKGLSLLQTSVSHLPKIGSVTDWSQEQLDLEIEKILGQQVSSKEM